MVYRYVTTRRPLIQLRDEMDRLLSGFLSRFPAGTPSAAGRGQPAVNAWEVGDEVFAEMEVPGVGSDQIEVAVVGNELSLCIRREEVVREGVTYHRRERGVGSCTRVVRLPVEVDADRVEAELSNGILTVTLPKAESAKPHKIRVAAG